MKTEGNHVVVSMNAKPGVDGIKHLMIAVDMKTKAPKYVRVRWGIFRIKVQLSNFKAGDISDKIFEFPVEKYKNYQTIDHRIQNNKKKNI